MPRILNDTVARNETAIIFVTHDERIIPTLTTDGEPHGFIWL